MSDLCALKKKDNFLTAPTSLVIVTSKNSLWLLSKHFDEKQKPLGLVVKIGGWILIMNIQTNIWRVYEFNSKPMSPRIGSLNLDNEIRTKITFFFSVCKVFVNKTKSSRWTLLYSVLCLSDLIEPWSRNFNHFSTNSRFTASNKNLTSIASSVFCQYHLVS